MANKGNSLVNNKNGMNPTAGSVSSQGDANTIRTDIGPANFNSAFRPSEGQIFTNLDSALRVLGSQPGIDTRDPKNPNVKAGGIDSKSREGI